MITGLKNVKREEVLSFAHACSGPGNLIQRAMNSRHEYGFTPGQGLCLAVILLRGGQAYEQQITDDYWDWVSKHGEPTWDKLDVWAASLDIEAGLAEPLVMATINRE